MNEQKQTFIERIATIDGRFAWSFLGVILAIGSGLFGIYSTFYYSPKPQLIVEKISETDVVKLAENISNLEIFYDSTNIRESNKNLKILIYKVLNRGDKSINENSYASTHPIELKVEDGKVVQSPLIIDASNDYLKDFDEIQFDSEKQTAILPSCIMESGEFYLVKFLILHENLRKPVISITGKIEGQNSIQITESISDSNPKQRKREPKEGVQIVLMLIGFILLPYFLLWMIKRIIVTKRENKIAKFIIEERVIMSPQTELILREYAEENGSWEDLIIYFLIGSSHSGIGLIESKKERLKNEEISKFYTFVKQNYISDTGQLDQEKIRDIQNACGLVLRKYVDFSNFDLQDLKSEIEVLEKFILKNKKRKRKSRNRI